MNPKHDHAVNAIDYSTFPKEYDIKAEERAVRERWERLGLYRFDPDSSAPGFSIDTPPPTVSGALHIGHVFSYTQAEIVARFERMRGKNVFYPFGFDDNGLPTERLAEREIGRRGADMPRPEFVARCLEVSSKYEARFRDLWKSLGFSTQWDLLYSTNDPGSRAESQRSFIELARSGRIYRASRPTQSCPLCGTAVAQAEAEDREIPSTMATIAFHLSDGSILPIATTRPELLPSLAAIFFAPGDPRYARFEGRTATDPIFGIRAPILADARADPAKGTGIVMACAYGDSTDVAWFETRGWTANETIGRNGRMNDRAGVWAGLPIEEARSRALGELAKRGALISTTTIRRAVNVHERCGTPLEWFSTEAWFVRLLDLKADILRAADEIEWRPAHMKDRLVAWTLGLERDWCASRSRFFGVPFPVWYCKRCGAAAFADEADLPVDPTVSMPRRACACGSMDFYPDPDVMDTWMTSSLSPRIAAGRRKADSSVFDATTGTRYHPHVGVLFHRAFYHARRWRALARGDDFRPQS